MKPLVRSFQDGQPYHQEEPGDASFRWLLKQDEIPGISMGLVKLKGPIHKTPAAHSDFDQAYLVQSGSGLIRLGNDARRVDGPTVVVIPKNTIHSVELTDKEELCYVFVNQYRA